MAVVRMAVVWLGKALRRAAAMWSRASRWILAPPAERRIRRWRRDRGDETLRLDYPLDAESTVVDLGGYEGAWSDSIFSRYGCTIHVFEPVPAFASEIETRFSGNSRVTVHEFGLSDRTREETLTLERDSSSLHRSGGRTQRVQLRRAADFLMDEGLDRIDLMKINIEGGEYDLLEHLLDSDWIPRIADLQVQFHDFLPDAIERMHRIQERLQVTHRPTWRYPLVWENWRLREVEGGS